MRIQKRLFVLALVASLFMLYSVNPANATYMTNGTINWIGVTPNGDHYFNVSLDSWTKTFTVPTSAANANAILAVLLTAHSTGDTVTIDFSGSTINAVYL